jgi:hypothetical protein
MRILYAAGNRLGSYYQLKRFLNSIYNKNYNIKIAAYKNSIQDLDCDYILDSLFNFTGQNATISFNGNYLYYRNEIKRFNPDLIISDFEIYTSLIADELKIKLWQYSPINLYYALDTKTKHAVEIHKYCYHLIEADPKKVEYFSHIFNRSDRKFVLSHLCDNETNPTLINKFEWVRPEFILGEDANYNNGIIALSKINYDIIDSIKNKNARLFLPHTSCNYDKIMVADINKNLYKNSLDNCNMFITDGTATFLADAFYNQKYSYSISRYDDFETIVGSYTNQYYNIGSNNLDYDPKKINIKIDKNVKFLSEHLGEL